MVFKFLVLLQRGGAKEGQGCHSPPVEECMAVRVEFLMQNWVSFHRKIPFVLLYIPPV